MYGEVPPVMESKAPPSENPHEAIVFPLIAEVGPAILLTVTIFVAVQPLESVTLILYVPEITPFKFCPACELDHKYVYGPFPPVAIAMAPPFAFPQVELTTLEIETEGPAKLFITAVAVVMHAPQETVTVYVPAERLIAV